jgi:hypothetical protein
MRGLEVNGSGLIGLASSSPLYVLVRLGDIAQRFFILGAAVPGPATENGCTLNPERKWCIIMIIFILDCLFVYNVFDDRWFLNPRGCLKILVWAR